MNYVSYSTICGTKLGKSFDIKKKTNTFAEEIAKNMRSTIHYYIIALVAISCNRLSESTADESLIGQTKYAKAEGPTGRKVDAAEENALLVSRIAKQSRLFTAEYKVHKIVTHEDLLKLKGQVLGIDFEHRFHIGDRRIAIPLEVTLKAYVDFSKFTARNVEQRNGFIHITLPDPKIVLTASKVDHKGIRQFTSFWRSAYTDEEMTDFTRQGVESILEDVPNMSLLHTARDCAAQTLIPLLSSLGYEEDHIIITFRDGLKPDGIEGLERLKEIRNEIH